MYVKSVCIVAVHSPTLAPGSETWLRKKPMEEHCKKWKTNSPTLAPGSESCEITQWKTNSPTLAAGSENCNKKRWKTNSPNLAPTSENCYKTNGKPILQPWHQGLLARASENSYTVYVLCARPSAPARRASSHNLRSGSYRRCNTKAS